MGDTTPPVRLEAGTVVENGAALAVNARGRVWPVGLWHGVWSPQVGDTVRVLVVGDEAVVLGPVAQSGSRPVTGTVAGAAVGGVVPVAVPGGEVEARYVGTAPSIGWLVRLDWQSTTPWVWPGQVTPLGDPTPPAPPPGPPPPPGQQTGVQVFTATDSGTWSVASSNWSGFYGRHVTQGTWAGAPYAGSWFYGPAPTQLRGRTITAARLRLGARRRLGNYNDPVAIRVHRHTSLTRPGGDVTRTHGPHDITLPPGAGAGWHTIPTVMGQAIADDGGGISIAGCSYAGVTGAGAGAGLDPASGQIELTWSRGGGS